MARLAVTAAALVVTLAAGGACWAQAFPSRPVTMIVPFAAGGPADVIARVLAERMRVALGQPVVIENVAGAAGTIATGRVARATPDGYTLSIGPGSSTQMINGAIYALSYDLVKDFEPVALLSDFPQLIVAKKAMPADDLKASSRG
jgi:tripartite-type tricarboxylate transporter receptor subunit TctC